MTTRAPRMEGVTDLLTHADVSSPLRSSLKYALDDLARKPPLAQLDGAIAELTKRGRANGALEAIAAQRKVREALVSQRRHEADALADLKSEAAAVAARGWRIEVEAAPIVYVAQLLGGSTEQAIRLLILLMVLTCDPMAIALTAAAAAR